MSLLRSALAGAAYVRSLWSVRFWSLVAYLRLRTHGAAIGRGLTVRGPLRLRVHRTASIRIGEHCRLISSFSDNPVGSARMSIWVGPMGRLELGHRVGLSNCTIVCMDAVTIDDEALVGGGCQLFDTDFHALDPEERALSAHPQVRTTPVEVRRRAFVGGYSILLKGSVVGEGAVLGAGSVLRSAIPDRQVWAGNPARFLRVLDARPRPARSRVEPVVEDAR